MYSADAGRESLCRCAGSGDARAAGPQAMVSRRRSASWPSDVEVRTLAIDGHRMVRSRFSGRSAAGAPARRSLVSGRTPAQNYLRQAPCRPACRHRRRPRRRAGLPALPTRRCGARPWRKLAPRSDPARQKAQQRHGPKAADQAPGFLAQWFEIVPEVDRLTRFGGAEAEEIAARNAIGAKARKVRLASG